MKQIENDANYAGLIYTQMMENADQVDLNVTFHASKPCHRLNPMQRRETQIVSIGVETVL